MIKIRRKTFETNSSSCHSVSIGEYCNIKDTSLFPDENGVIILTGGEYGWQWEKSNKAIYKANYAATDFDRNEKNTELLIDIIKSNTGAKEVIIKLDKDTYIDHDSVGTTPTKDHDLENFIFNSNCYLFLGNDNQEAPPEFYDKPGTKYNYKVSCVEYPELFTRVTNKPTKKILQKIIYSWAINIVIGCKNKETIYNYKNNKGWTSSDEITFEFRPWYNNDEIKNVTKDSFILTADNYYNYCYTNGKFDEEKKKNFLKDKNNQRKLNLLIEEINETKEEM